MFKHPDDLTRESLKINSPLRLFQIYKKLKYVSLKIDSYFQVYEEIFTKYVNKEIVFVEIGVLGGGSLQMLFSRILESPMGSLYLFASFYHAHLCRFVMK